MTRAHYLSSAGEQAWTWLRRHLDRADAFWLGFVLTDNLITAGILHERAQYNRRVHSKSFVDLHPATPTELANLIDRIEAESAGTGGCTWVQAVHRPDPEWEAAWNTLLQSLNHRRDYLRDRLGGLVLVAPPIVKTYAQDYSADLWSVRDLLVELPTEADEFSMPALNTGASTNTGVSPSLTNVSFGPVTDKVADETSALLAMPRDALATTARDRAARATQRALNAGNNQVAALLLAARAIGYGESGDDAAAIDLVRRGLTLTGVDNLARLSLLDLAYGLTSAMEPLAAAEYAEVAAELAAHLAEENRTAENLAELANRLDLLSTAFAAVGYQQAAMEASQRAVATARALVEIDPSRYQPDLAHYLNVLGTWLNIVQRFDDATVAWREAEAIYRGLIDQNLSENRPILARVLVNLSNQVNVSPYDALALSQEAEALLRGLDPDPDYPPDLVEALVSQRRALALLGRLAEAVAAGQEAVALARELALSDPGTYRRWLAVALMSHGEDLADIGREREALSAVREAVGIYAELAEESDDQATAQSVELSALGVMARLAERLGLARQAREAWHTVVDGYRQLATQGTGYLPDLARALAAEADAAALVGEDGEADRLRAELAELRGEGGDPVE